MPHDRDAPSPQDSPADSLDRVVEWLGLVVPPHHRSLLERYGEWLVDEALPAGGIGPGEGERVVDRHLADAVAFVAGLQTGGRDAAHGSLLDVGSGAGLPGIPLAIALPDVAVTLLDRSGRRTDLAARAVRVLRLPNVEVVQGDARRYPGGWDAVTMRAVLPLPEAVPTIRRLLAPHGVGVVGGSRDRGTPPDVGVWGSGVDVVGLPADVLDSPGWLLTIRP